MARTEPLRTAVYVVVIGVGFLVDVGVFALLHGAFGIPFAQWVARLAGAAVGFWLHRRFTFRAVDARQRAMSSQLMRFALIWLINYVVSTAGIVWAVSALRVDPVVAKFSIEVILAALGFVVDASVRFWSSFVKLDRISVVVPAYNEAGNLPAFVSAIRQALTDVPQIDWQVWLVDDGSRDETWREIAAAATTDPRFRGVRFVRNFGKEAAIEAGLQENSGADACVVMDADLQHPPVVVADLIARWRAGDVDVVSASKLERQDESAGMRLAARLFYRVFHGLTRLDLRQASDFKLLSQRVVVSYLALPERGKFFRGLTPWLGYHEDKVPFVVADRHDGTDSRWTLRGLLRYGWAAVLSFSGVPLRLIRYLAVCMGLVAGGLGLQTLWSKFAGHSVEGFTTVILLMLIMGSAVLFSLGIIGDYLERIYAELKGRPNYIIDVRTHPHRSTP